MRTIFSFLLSVLAGVVVVQVLALWSGGQDEVDLLYALPAVVAAGVSVLLLIARLRPDPVRTAGRIAKVLLVMLPLGLVGLALLFVIDEGPETLMDDGVILVGMFVPAMAVVVVQWLMFGHNQAAPLLIRFGRSAA